MCRVSVRENEGWMVGACGHRFPIVNGVPHMAEEFAKREVSDVG